MKNASPWSRALAGALLCLASGVAAAQSCAGGARMIIPFAVGSINDIMARAVAQEMGNALHETIVPENRVGAGGMIATQAVAKAPKDGCTLGLATSSQMVANVGLYKTLPFDVDRDLAYVGLLSRIQLVLVVSNKHQGNLNELLAQMRSKPGAFNFGSGGTGGISHLVAEAFLAQTGTTAKHVPYKGNALALNDLAGNYIDFLFDPLVTSQPLAEQGRMRMVAISGSQRSPRAPHLPTFAEQGLPSYEAYTWNGVIVPSGVPAERMERLREALAKALASASVQQIVEQSGSEVIGPSTPQKAAEFASAERAKWLPLIRRLNITLN